MQTKRDKIRSIVGLMLNESNAAMFKALDKVLNSGAVDVDGWDGDNNPMLLPKAIVTALLEDEATQRTAKGTRFEKAMRKEVKNIRCFI